MQDVGDVLITPFSNLSINLFLIVDGAEGGSVVPANITIEHTYFGSEDAHDLVITLPTEDQELIMSDNATANFSNGTEIVFSKWTDYTSVQFGCYFERIIPSLPL